MAGTIRVRRNGGAGPCNVRPLQVLIGGREAGSIAVGESGDFGVAAGSHRVQVRQDRAYSPELGIAVEEGATLSLECGCVFASGLPEVLFLGVLAWLWRRLVPGKLFYLRPARDRGGPDLAGNWPGVPRR